MAHREMTAYEIENVLASERIVRIAFESVGEHYLVPVGYVWHDRALHFAGQSGKKTRMAQRNPSVAFQVDTSSRTGVFEWASVTGEGIVEFIREPAAIAQIRPLLFGRFHDMPAWMAAEYGARDAAGDFTWARLTPLRMTGRLSGAAPALISPSLQSAALR